MGLLAVAEADCDEFEERKGLSEEKYDVEAEGMVACLSIDA